jgi:hypothetical protein
VATRLKHLDAGGLCLCCVLAARTDPTSRALAEACRPYAGHQLTADELLTEIRRLRRPRAGSRGARGRPGHESAGAVYDELIKERLAAFSKLVDLLLRLNPDKKRPTIPLDDSFLWLLDRRYLGRWWASCRDDLGLDDKAV